ncbi:hypothetical protein [Antrihabitans cavernicola]|uniref:DUF8021 domain-containing protein n=1 Tax=Antrihabitans cavernicola TaxID=2495913 RepID=A0A5A7SEA8_9NOCA|nr:hypothetical protein [Spelaeibacter cavernicola]KAA0024490.1 hypothetical protein FOY51_00530 [Spelaeibacter cavernicola]
MTTQIDVARAYLDALISHDGDSVAFAPDAVRYENGLKTGRSGKHLRNSLTRGPQYRIISAIRKLTTSVDGDVVHTEYLLDAAAFGRRLATVRVVEDFAIPPADLLIHRIDAKISFRRR